MGWKRKMLKAVLELMDFKPFRGRTGSEDRLAIDIATMLRAATMSGKLTATWTHIPHEIGGRGIAAAIRVALAKAMGLIAGSGDYVFVSPEGGGWIEAKTPGNYASPVQKKFALWCEHAGVRYAVCRSVAEVEETLREWGFLKPLVQKQQ